MKVLRVRYAVSLTVTIIALLVILAAILWALRGGPPGDDGTRAGDSTGATGAGPH